MMKINFGKVLDCFSTISSSGSCFCINEYGVHDDDGFEKKPLMNNSLSNQDDEPKLMRLKDVINVGPPTLAFQLKPKVIKYVSFFFWKNFIYLIMSSIYTSLHEEHR